MEDFYNSYPSKEDIRKFKKREIFRLLLSKGKYSQAGLTRRLGCNKATVLSIVNELKEEGLIEEKGYGKSKPVGGKRPTILGVAGKGIYLFAVDFKHLLRGIQNIEVSLVNLKGQKKLTRTLALGRESPPDEFLDSIILEINRQRSVLIKKEPAAKIIAVAVAAGGRVDPLKGKIITSSGELKSLSGVPLTKRIAGATGLKTYIEDCVVFPAYEEFYMGAAVDRKSFVYLEVLPFIRAIIFLNGFMYRGQRFLAGEIGVSIGRVDDAGPEYLCDLFDHEIFGLSLLRDRISNPANSGLVYDFKERAKRALLDKDKTKVEGLVKLTSQVVVNTICFLDIPCIVLGGIPGRLQKSFGKKLEKNVKELLYFYRPGDFEIRFSSRVNDGGGAMRFVCFVADRMFLDPYDSVNLYSQKFC